MASDWEVEGEVVVEQRTFAEPGADDEGRRTEFVLQKLRVEATGAVEFRFGYRYRHADGRLQWVPNSPRIPPDELGELLAKGLEQGWIGRDLVRQLAASARPLAAASIHGLRHRVESLMQGLLSRLPTRRATDRPGA